MRFPFISAIQAINNLNKDKYEVVPNNIPRASRVLHRGLVGKIEQYRDISALLKNSRQGNSREKRESCALIEWVTKGPKKKIYDYIDIAIPFVHGTNVEDGALQGFFKTLGVPFAGCDVLRLGCRQ
jgi:D-alanine-D-alanine ligase